MTQARPQKLLLKVNLVPRFSLIPVERPWSDLVTCLAESGRLQTKDLGGGGEKCEIVSTERRQVSCLEGHVFHCSRTSQDETSDAEINAQNPLTAKA